MKKDNVIGIIGGMGPAAGYDLCNKILDQTIAHNDFTHLPVALLSYPERIPDRSSFLFGQIDTNPAEAMLEIALQLESVGARVGCIPCNTAHAPAIFDVLLQRLEQEGSGLRMVHMIEETARFVRENNPDIGVVGLLSTTAVYNLRMYQNAMTEVGMESLLPSEEVQERYVNPVIFDETFGIKAIANPVHPQAREYLIKAILHLKERGATAVVLGCTELPLAITEHEVEGVKIIDPTVVLARTLIRETYPDQLKPL